MPALNKMICNILLIACYLTLQSCGKSGNTPPPATPPVVVDTGFINPLLSSGPDPWVTQKDTMYYYTNTSGNKISLYATSKMSDLKNARIVTIWTPPSSGPYSREIWAPEVHYLNDKWYVYFAADDGVNDNHRMYALQCDGADPMTGNWTFAGKIADTVNDRWAIDASVFNYKDQLYMVWSGWTGVVNTSQNLFIAKMKDPLTLDGERVLISQPGFAWEKAGAPPAVNEGPEALINPAGKLFLTFSASGCWTDNYALGLLSLKDGGDPLNPSDWTKLPDPILTTASSNGAFSPGHNGFFKSRDNKEDWIIYHANSSAGQGCTDRRNPRMQQFSWSADGTPQFGVPAGINKIIRKPGGE
jgi:GH43 family beta-xylosidase